MSRETSPFAIVDVECCAGYRGEETARRFRLGKRHVEIAGVIDRWLAPDHRYFKYKTRKVISTSCVTTSRPIGGEVTLFRRSASGGLQ